MLFENILEVVVVSASEYVLILFDDVDAFGLSPSLLVLPPLLEALFNDLLLLEELLLVLLFALLLLLSLLLQLLQLILS